MATIFRNSLMQDVRDYVIITIGLLLYSIGFPASSCPTKSRRAVWQVPAL